MPVYDSSISDFYESRPGRTVQELLRKHVERIWPSLGSEHIGSVGLGALALPPSCSFSSWAMRPDAAVPCLADSHGKTAPDNAFDRMIVLHAETATETETSFLVRECGRTLKGEGRLLIAVPRKNGNWANKKTSPFRKEACFSRKGIRKLLFSHGFVIDRIERALYAPPGAALNQPIVAKVAEAAGPWLFPQACGVFLIDARKRVEAPVSVRKEAPENRAESFLPQPFPV